MNDDLQRICQWTFTNKLLLNLDKTKFVIFGSRPLVSKVEDLHLSLLGKELTPAKSAKDLGVILDSNLTYDDHVTKTVSTCMSRLGQINRVKHVLDKDTLTIVVNWGWGRSVTLVWHNLRIILLAEHNFEHNTLVSRVMSESIILKHKTQA